MSTSAWNVLELRVLALLGPTVDVTALQAGVESLREDLDTILEARVLESKAPLQSPLRTHCCWTSSPLLQCHPPRDCSKRHRVRDEAESWAQKMERHELEAARRASLIDEEACQLRAI